jgi:outer membrane protein OmpA-like peptidoglycan-associated protein
MNEMINTANAASHRDADVNNAHQPCSRAGHAPAAGRRYNAMNKIRLALILAAGIGGMQLAHAQEGSGGKILVGPGAGFDAGMQSSQINIYNGSSDCGQFESGSSSAPWFGGTLMLPSLFSDALGFSARAAWSNASGHFTATPNDPQRIFDASTSTLVDLEREFRLNSTVQTVSLDLQARYRVADRLLIGVGPSLGFRLSSTFTQTDNITGPGNRRFADGTSERPMADGTPLTKSSIGFGGVLSGAYELPIGGSTILLPELTLRADLGSPAKEVSWTTMSIGGSLSLLFDVTPSPAAPPPPPPPPPIVEAPRPSKLTASLEAFGIDANDQRLPAATIRIHEVINRQHIPLLPVVYFDQGSTEIPERYVKLDRGQTESFGPDALAGLDPLKGSRQALNVLGMRLRVDPASKITLYGLASGDESGAMAAQRGETVRGYLRDVWGIEPSRVAIKTGTGSMPRSNEATEDGRAENRRVEVTATTVAALAPVVSERIERDYDPPLVKLKPWADAEAGVKRWELTISQQGKVLQRYSGESAPTERSWRIDRNLIDTSTSPLVVDFSVEDAKGQKATAQDRVPLTLKRSQQIVDMRSERSGGHERIEYSIVGFDYNSADLRKRNEATVKEIADVIAAGAHVTVTGYTDRIGDEQYNITLSRQRADRVAQTLRSFVDARGVGSVDIETVGAGVDVARFENNLPEGRVLSRGVSVIVDQGAEPEEVDHP